MNKELEKLEEIKHRVMYYADGHAVLGNEEVNFLIAVAKSSLQRLEAIDDVNSSDALRCLHKIGNSNYFFGNPSTVDKPLFDTVEHALNKFDSLQDFLDIDDNSSWTFKNKSGVEVTVITKKNYDILEQALQRLKAIDNAKPSEVLKKLEMLSDCAEAMKEAPSSNWIEYANNETELDYQLWIAYEDLKQYILKSQEQEKVLDYITRFIDDVEISDNGVYYVSFKNDTPYVDCIEMDEDHYNKLKKIKESQKGE